MSVRTIVVGIDDSPGSRAAISWVADLAGDLGARVVVLHVFEPLAHLAELKPGVDLPALRDRAAENIRGPLCQPLRERGIVHVAEVHEGNPAQVVAELALATGADLIVVGARRMGRVKGIVLGSTAARVVELARCPVTIVHAPDLRDDLHLARTNG